jgi:L-iditol 2-dehydrogenase
LTIALSRRMKHAYPRAIRLAASRTVDLSALVTHRYPLDEIEPAIQRLARRDGIKVIVDVAASVA